MKPRTLCITALTLLTALSVPVRLAAQDNQDHHHQHHRYTLFDIGTLGGPVSTFPSLSNRGVVAGWSATPKPLTPTSNPFICGGVDGLAPFITVAYKFEHGARSVLGNNS